MCDIARRKRVRHVEVATGAPIPLRWVLGVGPALAAAIVCSAAALADGPEPSAAPRSETSCQDQFMIDRRDEPSQALRHLQQCNAVRNLAGNMEYFTLWYVTLPPALRHKQDGMFEKVWKNNLGLLTGRIVSFRREQAIKVLDDSILRALKRGKREDLVARWLASHDPELLALDPPGSASAQATPVRAPERAVAAASVTRMAVSTPLPEAAKPVPPRAAETPRRLTRRSNSRPAQGDRDVHEYTADSDVQVLNRTQLDTGGYAAAPVAPLPYPAQPYYPVAPQPAAYLAPPPPTATYLPPSGAAPVGQPAAAPPQVAADVQQSRSVLPSQTYPQIVLFPPQVALIGQQIDTNVRTISGLIENNLRTFEKVLLGTGTPPAQP